MIGVATDGTLIVEAGSKLSPVLDAHLGVYDPATDTLELLQFVAG